MSATIDGLKYKSANLDFLRKTASYITGGAISYISDAMSTSTSVVSEAKNSLNEINSAFGNAAQRIVPKINELKRQKGFKGILNWFTDKNNEYGFSDSSLAEWDGELDDEEILDTQLSEIENNANKISKSVIESSQQLVEAEIASTGNIINEINKQSAIISSGFEKTNRNLEKILEVVTKNTASIIEHNTLTASSNSNKDNSSDMLNYKFDLSEYKKLVTKQLADSEIGMLGSMVPMLMGNIKNFGPKDITSIIVKAGINKAVPNMKKNLETLDDVISDTIMSSLIRIGERNNGIGLFSKIFGIKAGRDKIDTSQERLELKSVPYDTLSRDAITNEIPGYLRKILVAVGGEDLVYDPRTKSFKSRGSITKEFRNTAASTNTIHSASKDVRNTLGTDKFTAMTYDLMMNDLGSKVSNGTQARDTISSFSNIEAAQNYIINTLYGGKLSNKDLEKATKMAQRLSKLPTGFGEQDILLQAAKNNLNRNNRMNAMVSQMHSYGIDISHIDDNSKADRNTVLSAYGRKDLLDDSIEIKSSGRSKVLSGVNYTNMALYEIFRRLDNGINVFQVGNKKVRKTPFKKLGDKYLINPINHKPKNISDASNDRSDRGSDSRSNDDYENPLINHTDEEGNEENLSRSERLQRWGRQRGGNLIHSIFSGSPEEVRAAFGDITRDVAGVAGGRIKVGAGKINDAYGNVKGYIRHKLTGKGYSYQDGENKSEIADNDKGGLFGFIRDEAKSLFGDSKDSLRKWTSDVLGYFDYGDSDPDDKKIAGKRKKLITMSIGAFAGAGILGGPIGLMAGALAGSALSSGNIGNKLKEKLFGRDDETGKATGLLTKGFDKITRPLQYQFEKSAHFISGIMKKNVFGPLSDLGLAIKDRAMTHVDSAFKRVTNFMLKPFKWAGSKLLKGAGWVGEKLYNSTIGAFGEYNRAKLGVSTGIFGNVTGLLASGIAGKKSGHYEVDPVTGEKTWISTRDAIKERRAARKRDVASDYDNYKFGNYSDWNEQQDLKAADRRKRLKDYTSEAERQTEQNTSEVANNTAEIAETLKDSAAEQAKENEIERKSHEMMQHPGSIYTHDIHLEKQLDQLLVLLGGTPVNVESVRGIKKHKKDRDQKDLSGDDFANSAVSAAASLAVSGDDISNDESRAASDIIDEATKPNSSKFKISQKLKDLMGIQKKKSEVQGEKKSTLWDMLTGFLSNASSLFPTILGIGAAALGLWSLFKNGGMSDLMSRIGNGIESIVSILNPDDDTYGKDATTKGANAVLSLADMNVKSILDLATPGASIFHNERDGAGNRIRNSSATEAKEELLWKQNARSVISDRPTHASASLSAKSSKAWNRHVNYNNKAIAAEGGNWFQRNVTSKIYRSKANSNLQKSVDYENQANSSVNTTVHGGVLNQMGRIGTLWGTSKIAGWGTKNISKAFGASDEASEIIGNVGEGATSAFLTQNMIRSTVKGKKSIVDYIKDHLMDGFKWLAKKLKAEKFVSAIGSKIDDLFTKVYKAVIGNLKDKLVNKIIVAFSKFGIEVSATAATLGLTMVVGAVSGAVSGYCGTEHLFGILPGEADASMKAVSTVLQGAFGALEWSPFGWIAAIIDVIDMILIAIPGFGVGLKQLLGRYLWAGLEPFNFKERLATLEGKQNEFKSEIDRYNEKYGTDMNMSTANDLYNNTGWLDTLWRGKKSKGEDGTYDNNFNEAGGEKFGGIKGALVTTGDTSFAKDNSGNVLRINGNAVENKDIFGNTKMKTYNVGDYASTGFSTMKKLLTGTTIYKTDENGNAVIDENGNYVVDHEESGILSWINPFNKDRKKNMEDDVVIKGTIDAVKNEITNIAKDGVNTVGDFFTKPFRDMKKTFEDATGITITGEDGLTIKDAKGNAVTMAKLGDYFKEGMADIGSKIVSSVSSVTDGIKDGAADLKDNVVSGAKSAWNFVSSGVSGILGRTGGPMSVLDGDPNKPVDNRAASISFSGDGNPLSKAFKVTSGFGYRDYPYEGMHDGIDLVPSDGSSNADVGSTYEGTVVDVKRDVPNSDHGETGPNGDYEYYGSNETGNMVSIKTANGSIIKSMHLKAGSIPSSIKVGSKVKAGSKIGEMGNTGRSFGSHLHYQIEDSEGNPVDPSKYLYGTQQSNNYSDYSSGYNTSYSSGNYDSTATSSAGPLAQLIESLKQAGSSFLNKITGGLFGSDYSSTVDTDGYINPSSTYDSFSGSNGGLLLTNNPNTEWVSIIREVKKLVADQMSRRNLEYNQSGYIDINYGGKNLKVRTDCTGIISAMLKIYGVLPVNSNVNSTLLLSKNAIPSGFTQAPWPGWDKLVEGDIVVKSGHAEIFASNNGGKHYVYNGGSTKSLRSAGATGSSYSSYSVIWRCNEAGSAISDSSTMDIASGAAPIQSTTERDVWNHLKRLGYSDIAAAGIMGAWANETGNRPDRIEGDYLFKDAFNTALKSNEALDDYTLNKLFPAYKKISINKSAYVGEDGHYYPGVGIAQWTGPRGRQLFEFAKSKGKDWRSLDAQIEFFQDEMNRRVKGINQDDMNGINDTDSAANLFSKKFEGVSSKKTDWLAARRNSAKALYSVYAGKDDSIDGPALGGPISTGHHTNSSSIDKSNYRRRSNDTGQIIPFNNRNDNNFTLPSSKRKVDEMQDGFNKNNPDLSQVVNMLAQVVKYLEVISSNTGESNDLLDVISQKENHSVGKLPKTVNKKSGALLNSSNSTNSKLIAKMARP